MLYISDCLKQTIAPLCEHSAYKHLRIFLIGENVHNCVLSAYITNKKFLNKVIIEKMYNKFLRLWTKYDKKKRRWLKRRFGRMVITRGFFIFLAYLYLLFRKCKILKFMKLYDFDLTWIKVEDALQSYSLEKYNRLFDNPCLVEFNELHNHICKHNLIIPIPNHCNAPCMKLYSLKGYDKSEALLLHRNLTHNSIDDFNYVPCGNFMFAMGKALVENYCYKTDRFMLPISNNHLSPLLNEDDIQFPKIITYALTVILKNNLVTSIFDLPVHCLCKTKCQLYNNEDQFACIICMNCGYCLNVGKEKLKIPQGFSLSAMFYYRDKQEKCILYSMHSATMYCSLCGSKILHKDYIYSLDELKTANITITSVKWKAVIGSNTACTVFNDTSEFDVIVACSSRTCYSTVKISNVTYNKLLNLISHNAVFQCQECKVTFKETCLDLKKKKPCKGCILSRNGACFKNERTTGGSKRWSDCCI